MRGIGKLILGVLTIVIIPLLITIVGAILGREDVPLPFLQPAPTESIVQLPTPNLVQQAETADAQATLDRYIAETREANRPAEETAAARLAGYETATALAVIPTQSPLDLARSPVSSNSEWTPVEREFNGVTMVLVPAGCFMMGSENGHDDEQPVHQQCFEEPFWIDVYEVTNEKYGSPDCVWSSEPMEPRNCVTWFESRDFCEARNARLPTEAEWEYAARGPDNLVYPWGDLWNPENLNWAETEEGLGGGGIAVGSFPEGISWVGALDMVGNLSEWTSSFYEPYPYDISHEGQARDNSLRVLRGGSFGDFSFTNRGAERDESFGNDDYIYVGFRCVRDIDA